MEKKFLTTVEISKNNLIHNLLEFRRILGKEVKIMGVVKSNAYGHGILEVSRILYSQGIDFLGVSSLEEGVFLRQAKINVPILVLGYIPLSGIGEAIKNNLSFVVYNKDTIKKAVIQAKKLNKPARIHFKIETGTNRQGVLIEKVLDFIKFVRKRPEIFIEGIYSHFANIEDGLDYTFPMKQLEIFKRAILLIENKKISIPLKHIACSAAAILFPQTYFNMVRIGISLYGLWPSKETKISDKNHLELRPVLTWKTKVAQIKEIKKGESVGYGRTWWASRKTKIAVLPVGYWDGYDRRLSNVGRVLIHGEFAQVVGRICMNMLMVDITDIPNVKLEDEVILIGKQGENEITVEELAQKVGTINYEIVTRINPLLPRIVI
jgi:alanine racemase